MNENLPSQRLRKGLSALLARLLCINKIVPPASLFRKSVVVTMRTPLMRTGAATGCRLCQ